MSQCDGRMKLVVKTTTSTGAGLTTVAFQPDAGKEWEILWLVGSQADGAVAVGWWWNDPEGGGQLMHTITGALNTKWMFGAFDDEVTGPIPWGPVFANAVRYPSYTFVASAISKVGTVTGLVIERVGVGADF